MSAERVSIPIDQIHVPDDYIRPLDEAAALTLARLMETEGQKTAIAIYRSSARDGGQKPFTLVYGARRLWAAGHLGWSAIEAVLRTKAEAPILAIADNFAMPTLDTLEQGEHVASFAGWWIEENGEVTRGGDRKSKFYREALIQHRNKLEKSSFYKDLTDKLGISKSTAWRLLKIGSLHRDLRDALRGSSYANDHKRLTKLTKLALSQQIGVANRLKEQPDLDAILRTPDPETGREAVGRMERKDWQKLDLFSRLNALSVEDRIAYLSEYGFIRRPVDPWPEIDPTIGVAAPGNRSPLWSAVADPMALRQHVSADEVRGERASEKTREHHYLVHAINEMEQSLASVHKAEVAKDAARRSRKPKRGRPADTREMKFAKMLVKGGVLPDLADRLVNVLKVDRTYWIAKEAHKLTEDEARNIVGWINGGDDVERASYRVMKMLEAREG